MWWALLVGLVLFAGGKVGNLVMDKKTGLSKIAAAAQATANENRIPIALIVTQAVHESNYGSSGLAQKSNNLFGIKAAGTWKGPADDWPTTEYVNGVEKTVHAYFRHYASWDASVRDWMELIKSRYPRAYAAALAHDSLQFFRELQAGGYATDPNYSSQLARVYSDIKGEIA